MSHLFLYELNHCFDIICFSETWFSSDDCVQLAGYECVSACRSRKAGGGVAIYIRSELSYKIVPDYKIIDDNVECIVSQCWDILFALLYRPPSGSVNDFLHLLETEQSMELKSQVVLVGDLNINVSADNVSYLRFQEIFESYGFANTISEPTRITPTSETTLDLCITNLLIEDLRSGVLACDISDHFPIYCLLPVNQLRKHEAKTLVRDYSERNIQHFKDPICCQDWDSVLRENDANTAYETFLSCFVSAYNTSFTLKTPKKHKKTRKPWISHELYARIKNRNKLFQIFLKTRSESDFCVFKKVRNKLNSDIKKAKCEYYMNKFSEVMGDPRMIWQTVNEIISKNTSARKVQFYSGADG